MNLLFTSYLHFVNNEMIPDLAELSTWQKHGILIGVTAFKKSADMSVNGYIDQRCKCVSPISDGAPWFHGALSGRLPRLLVKSDPADGRGTILTMYFIFFWVLTVVFTWQSTGQSQAFSFKIS